MRRTLAVCALVVATIASNAFAVTQVRVSGKVVDAATKQPISDVVIHVSATEMKNFNNQFKAKKDGTYAIMLQPKAVASNVTKPSDCSPTHGKWKSGWSNTYSIPRRSCARR